MSDATLRRLSRQAATGDVEAQARELLERVRSGSLSRERLELAAYCGSTQAREALGGAGLVVTGKDGEGRTVDLFEAGPSVHRVHFWPWVEGLERWRRLHAPVVAAVAAARFAAQRAERGQHYTDCPEPNTPRDHACPLCVAAIDARARRAVEAAEAWCAQPCDRYHVEWANRSHNDRGWTAPKWLPCPPDTGLACATQSSYYEAIRAAIEFGEQGIRPVREAICAALARTIGRPCGRTPTGSRAITPGASPLSVPPYSKPS